jgi:hypothetical protein
VQTCSSERGNETGTATGHGLGVHIPIPVLPHHEQQTTRSLSDASKMNTRDLPIPIHSLPDMHLIDACSGFSRHHLGSHGYLLESPQCTRASGQQIVHWNLNATAVSFMP